MAASSLASAQENAPVAEPQIDSQALMSRQIAELTALVQRLQAQVDELQKYSDRTGKSLARLRCQ
jgi:hypothetical protein